MSREILQSIYSNDIARVNSIIRSGFDAKFVSEDDKWNLLHLAFMSLVSPPTKEMLDCLIKHGVDINAKDRYRNTPLHYAARLKDPMAIASLLRAGAFVDPVNNNGATPLRLLMSTKPYNLESINLFFINGANVTEKNRSGISILDYVRDVIGVNNKSLVKVFKEYSQLKSK